MKFHVWSDLHTELTTINHVKKLCKMYFKKDLESSLILAGDIGKPNDKRYLYVLDWCSRRYKKIFIIAGNHEFYNSFDEHNQVLNQLRDICKRFSNVYFMDKNVYCDTKYIIFGCTLWTTINKLEYEYAYRYYNDFKRIKDIAINDWHKTDLNWLAEMMQHYKDDIRTKIIITHHMPSYQLIDSKYKNSPINSAFANTDCDSLLANANFWIYGHTHTSHTQKIGECMCICNPIGYEDENEYITSHYFKI